MVREKSDFLKAIENEYEDQDHFVKYLDSCYRNGVLSKEFNIIAAINNLEGGHEVFFSNLKDYFEVLSSSGDLHLLYTSVDDDPVYSYVYLDDDAPVFFTNANKTDQIPPTILRFILETPGVGRVMLSERKLDEIRNDLVSRHDNLLVPYFSATRSKDSPIEARRRENTKRSLEYHGVDGLQSYREMRYQYGILPSIMVFEKPNHFKFKIKSDGTFVHQDGSLKQHWAYLKEEIKRSTEMKEYANTGGFGQADSSFFGENKFDVSKPWAIEVKQGIESNHLYDLEKHLNDSFWEFNVSEYTARPEFASFEAEVIDEFTSERTNMKTKGDDIRIFPRKRTDIDQSLRIFNFVRDHFESDCTPKKVA